MTYFEASPETYFSATFGLFHFFQGILLLWLAGSSQVPLRAQIIQKSSRRLELSISTNTPHGRWGQGPGSVDPRFPAGLPFPVPEILVFVAFRDSGPGTPHKSLASFPILNYDVLVGNPFRDPKLPRTAQKFPDFRGKPGAARNFPGIPTQFILSTTQIGKFRTGSVQTGSE